MEIKKAKTIFGNYENYVFCSASVMLIRHVLKGHSTVNTIAKTYITYTYLVEYVMYDIMVTGHQLFL